MKRFLALIVSTIMLLSIVGVAFATDIPGGRYKIGEDIPAGAYTISVIKKGTNLTIWGASYEDNKANGGLLLNVVVNDKNPSLGKVILEAGNVIDFTAALSFEKYVLLELNWEEPNKTILKDFYDTCEQAGIFNQEFINSRIDNAHIITLFNEGSVGTEEANTEELDPPQAEEEPAA